MSGTPRRSTRISAFDPKPRAAGHRGGSCREALDASIEWNGEAGIVADLIENGDENADSASGLGAFYAYQMGVRSIERS